MIAQTKSATDIKMGDTTDISDYYNLKDIPAEIREKLAELDLELSEGECLTTQKHRVQTKRCLVIVRVRPGGY